MAGGLTLGVDWEALGAGASVAVDATHAILVTGRDPVAAARVAVGLGRAQSRSRRVAIGDLVGDVEPLQRLVTGDDPHGIVDSFLYGVSLNKIARQVDDDGMLFVMPSGTEPTVTPDIMANERWSRLAAGFREVGALLILVAPSDAEGVHALAEMLDGVVVVGDAASMLAVPRNSVLVHVESPLAATPLSTPTVPELPELPEVPVELAEPTPPETGRERPLAAAPSKDVRTPRVAVPAKSSVGPKVLIALAILAAVVALWFVLGRPGASTGDDVVGAVNGDRQAEEERVDSESVAQAVPAPAAAGEGGALVRIGNPQDSAQAAAYGVLLLATNDEAAALAGWASLAQTLPAGTVTMIRLRGEPGRAFQLQAGAYGTQRQADSLLAALRRDRRVKAGAGTVTATPLALRLESSISRQSARTLANAYGQRQIAAYAMLQADNTATIYVGAFESPEQAAPLMNELKLKGVNVALHYRTGRSF